MTTRQVPSVGIALAGLLAASVLVGCMSGAARPCESFGNSCACEPTPTGVGTVIAVCDTTFNGGTTCCEHATGENYCQCLPPLICVDSGGTLGCGCSLEGPAVPSQTIVPSCTAPATGVCCLDDQHDHCDCYTSVSVCPVGDSVVHSCTPDVSDSCGSGWTRVTSC